MYLCNEQYFSCYDNMNNILAFNIDNPNEVALQIASRVKARRLKLDLTQEGLVQEPGSSLPHIADLSRLEKFH